MEGPTTEEARALVDFLAELGAVVDVDAFVEVVVNRLERVIDADFVVYSEVNTAAGRSSVVSNVDVDEFGRPSTIGRQLEVLLPAPPPLVVRVVLTRSRGDFSDREEVLLSVLRTHLVNAYRNAQARAVASAVRGDVAGSGATVSIGCLGEPLSGVPAELGRAPDEFIDEMQQWIVAVRRCLDAQPEPLYSACDNGTIEARILAPGVARLRLVGSAEEFGSRASASVSALTERQREVLRYVARGWTDKAIAAAIGVRPATVRKHLEHIRLKLGVQTRTAAVAILQAHSEP